MKREQALEILKALAEGVIPHSGNPFNPKSAIHHPDIVCAFRVAIKAIQDSHRKTRENAGMPWEKKEIEELIKFYKSGKKVTEIAKAHKRTTGGIICQLNISSQKKVLLH